MREDFFATDVQGSPVAARVNYILRMYLPTWNYEERIEEVVRFCQETDTRHVMLFTDAQHICWNQLTLDEARHEAANIAKAKARLAEDGIRLGINSSYTMPQSRFDHRGHCDYDYWTTRADGSCDYNIPCLLDPKLDVYLKAFYTILAEVHPDYIFLDDDHRYLHLGANNTFGCHCELHLQTFSETSGRTWTREDLNEALLNDADVRRQWIDLLGKRMVEIPEIVSTAVHAVDPDIEIGQMVPCVHPLPAMGHTIRNVMDAMTPVRRPVVRPCIGPYSDTMRRHIIPGLFYLEFIGHVLGDDVDYTPELETTPHTRLSKSMTTVRFLITQALLNGMNNPALSTCGYVGSSPFIEPEWVPFLQSERAWFEGVRRLAPKRGTRRGVQFIFDFDSAKANPNPMHDVADQFWPSFMLSDFLGNSGFAYTYDESPVRFLAGDTVYALPDAQLEALLADNLILDASAARAFADRGYGDQIGCSPGEPLAPFGGELCTSEDYWGPYTGEYISYKAVPLKSVRALNAVDAVTVVSQVIDHDRKQIAPATILFENTRGGKVAVFAFCIGSSDPDTRHLVCYPRQWALRQILRWMAPETMPVFVEAPTDFAVQCWDDGNRLVACITNLSYDSADALTIEINADGLAPDAAQYLDDDGECRTLSQYIDDVSTGSRTLWHIRRPVTLLRPLIVVVERG
jgi:hypothetical protein